MIEVNEYAVLKFTAYNGRCHKSDDYISGQTLDQYLRYHPYLPKERLFCLIRELIYQLDEYHRCGENMYYRYISPYMVVVTGEERLALIDQRAEASQGLVHRMQHQKIRQHFLPQEEPYYQTASLPLDLYGLGRCIQYILAQVSVDPKLSWWEEYRFQKLIKRCLKYNSEKSYPSAFALLKYLPNIKRNKK